MKRVLVTLVLAAALLASGFGPSVASADSYLGTVKSIIIPYLCYLPTYFWESCTLRALGEHCEVWVSNYIPEAEKPTADQLAYFVETFDTFIYPETTGSFSEPTPRLGANPSLPPTPNYYAPPDGVERVLIVIHRVRDNYNLAPFLGLTKPDYALYGWYSDSCENWVDRNIIGINSVDWANRLGPDDATWRGTDPSLYRPNLVEAASAYYLQLLVQNDLDTDEEEWLDHVIAAYNADRLGFVHVDSDPDVAAYLAAPCNSLTNMAEGPYAVNFGYGVPADSGAVKLFAGYTADRFGAGFFELVATAGENGPASVDIALEAFDCEKTFARLYQEWAAATLINGHRCSGGGIYNYPDTTACADLSAGLGTTAPAWGPCYVELEAQPRITGMSIDGIAITPPNWDIVADPYLPANHVFHAQNGNVVDYALYAMVDLTAAVAPQLTFRALYDLEDTWDYGYVQVSTDDGKTWTSLSNADTTMLHHDRAHPAVVANLPGFTGWSGGWTTQAFDLAPYAGQQILLSFRHITDWASLGNGNLNVPGFYVDDIAISETSISSSADDYSVFGSIEQVRGVRMLASFIGIRKNPKATYRVLHLDPATVDSEGRAELDRFLHDASLDRIIVILSHAAAVQPGASKAFTLTIVREHRGKRGGPKP